jgi:hypothetical protein
MSELVILGGPKILYPVKISSKVFYSRNQKTPSCRRVEWGHLSLYGAHSQIVWLEWIPTSPLSDPHLAFHNLRMAFRYEYQCDPVMDLRFVFDIW